MAEAGWPAVEVPTWQGLYVAAKVPPAIRTRLATGSLPSWRGRSCAEFERRMLAARRPRPRTLAALIARELAAWAAVIDEYKLTAD